MPERDAELRVALARLPERQRTAVFLRYYADLDYAAIAEALGISAGTVAATLNAAHAALRTRLEEFDMTDLDRASLDRAPPRRARLSRLGRRAEPIRAHRPSPPASRRARHDGARRRGRNGLRVRRVRAYVLDTGFIGLPPEGATPSGPEGGELLVEFIGRSSTRGHALNRVWLYADGRMVSLREGAVVAGANEVTSGFLEQRLGPEGVELLLSELLATGLFDRDRSLWSARSPWGTVRVQRGDALVRLTWDDPRSTGEFSQGDTAATPEQEKALEQVDALLADPGSRLPTNAWDDARIRAYVASKYAICSGYRPDVGPMERRRSTRRASWNCCRRSSRAWFVPAGGPLGQEERTARWWRRRRPATSPAPSKTQASNRRAAGRDASPRARTGWRTASPRRTGAPAGS